MSTTVDTTKNPILQTHQGIWDCLTNNAAFAALVPAMNRINYTEDNRSPDKPGLTSAHFPQVRVVQLGLQGQIFRTSNSCSIGVLWGIDVKVGDKRLENLTELQFAIFCGMSKWETYLRDVVEFDDEKVFRKLTPMKVTTEYALRNKPPDPAGWQCVWQGVGELFLQTTAVQAYTG